MEKKFWSLYIRMFYKPKSTFEVVFESEKALKFGFFAILIPTIGYTLFYIMALFAGGSPSTWTSGRSFPRPTRTSSRRPPTKNPSLPSLGSYALPLLAVEILVRQQFVCNEGGCEDPSQLQRADAEVHLPFF